MQDTAHSVMRHSQCVCQPEWRPLWSLNLTTPLFEHQRRLKRGCRSEMAHKCDMCECVSVRKTERDSEKQHSL